MKRRISFVDIIILSTVAVFVALTLVPAIARMQRTPIEAKCQSNMRRWAEAMALYCADNQGRYPTNRPRITSGVGVILPTCNLSPDAPPGQPQPRFVHSYNWVEALYPYLQSAAEKTGQDWKSFRKCPAASSKTLPEITGPNYQVTYVMNRCLVEAWTQLVRQPRNLMMMRESGRLTMATLRPANDCTNLSSPRPIDPFCTAKDSLVNHVFTQGEFMLHANGSHVMFADGHVKAFDISYFSTNPPAYTTAASTYDTNTQQWYNYWFQNPVTPDQKAKHMSIAISP